MNASELKRKLLYCGYSDVTDYLMNNPVHCFIYREFLTLLPKNGIDVPVVKIFNEAYYQLICIPLDRHPGENLQGRYFEDCTKWLGCPNATELVFCIVEAFLNRKTSLLFQDECFLQQLQPLIDSSQFKPFAKDLNSYMESMGIFTPTEIKPMPIPVIDIPQYLKNLSHKGERSFTKSIMHALGMSVPVSAEVSNPWKELTENFLFKKLEWYIKLYTTIQDQQDLLDLIEKSCSEYEYKVHRYDFIKLRKLISLGEYEPDCFSIDCDPVRTIRMPKEYKKVRKHSAVEAVKQKTDKSDEFLLSVPEMIAIVKERFSKTSADEFCGMLSRLAVKHGLIGEEIWQMIDGIVPAVIQRDSPHQTFNLPNVQHFNNNPSQVIIHAAIEHDNGL